MCGNGHGHDEFRLHAIAMVSGEVSARHCGVCTAAKTDLRVSELADFCTSIGIIERGKLLAAGSIQEIQRQLRSHRVLKVRVLDDSSDPAKGTQAAATMVRGRFRHLTNRKIPLFPPRP